MEKITLIQRINHLGLIFILMIGLLFPSQTWAADLNTQAQQEQSVATAWEKQLGHPLVTEAYWPGKTWYNIKGKAVVYDGTRQQGETFYQQFIPEYFQILENMGLKVEISLSYEGGEPEAENTRQAWRDLVNKYATDDHYQLVIWYNNAHQFEGNALGGDQLDISYHNNGFFWGCDGRWYGYMGFAHLLQAEWAYYTISQDNIPSSGGYYTKSDDDFEQAKRFIGYLQACDVPFPEWDYRHRQVATNEHYNWATKAGLNDFLQIPRRDPNRPAHEYGIDGAKVLATGTRSGDYGPYLVGENRKVWWNALFTEYGQWQKTTQDSFGNYENITFALFCYFNDLPRGTKPIFPTDVNESTSLGQAEPAPNKTVTGNSSVMDSWAAAEINQMIKAGMIPATLQKDYKGAITRIEYAQVAAQALRSKYSLDNAGLLAKFDKQALPTGTFSDTSDQDVLLVAALGLVEGTGENKFSPTTTLTREQAATVLARLASLLNKKPTLNALTFSDSTQISSWAMGQVSVITGIASTDGSQRIMEGSNGKFDPKAVYQRQQCYITLLRLLGLPN